MAELNRNWYLKTYEEKGYKLGKVKMNTICYDYHDDVPFRVHYLMNNDISLMHMWRRLNHGKGSKGKKAYSAKYINKLLSRIVETPRTNTRFGWSCQEKKGQILMPVPFAVGDNGICYPAGGMGRIASAYYLGHRFVPAFLITTKEGRVWKKNFGVGSKHFNGMPEDIIKMLLFRREISNMFAIGILKKSINRSDFLYQVPGLAIRGKYDADAIIKDKTFISIIKNKNVLNIALDNGWFDVLCSNFVKSIVGYGHPIFKEIASRVYNYFNAKSGFFVSDIEKVNNDFDIVISNKSIKVPECSYILKGKKVIYNKNDCVAYG